MLTLRQYCKLFLTKRLAALDFGAHFTYSILDALHYIRAAWNAIKPESVEHCFAKAGFKSELILPSLESAAQISADEPITCGVPDFLTTNCQRHSDPEYDARFAAFTARFTAPSSASLTDYVSADDSVATGGQRTIDDIIEDLNPQPDSLNDDSDIFAFDP